MRNHPAKSRVHSQDRDPGTQGGHLDPGHVRDQGRVHVHDQSQQIAIRNHEETENADEIVNVSAKGKENVSVRLSNRRVRRSPEITLDHHRVRHIPSTAKREYTNYHYLVRQNTNNVCFCFLLLF